MSYRCRQASRHRQLFSFDKGILNLSTLGPVEDGADETHCDPFGSQPQCYFDLQGST
jgi:hypothetical protein